MASGNFNLTTWYAKRIMGDTGASTASDALLQTGTGVTGDIWILHRTDRTAKLYGVKYAYDSTNGHDKIEFYGKNSSDNATAWVQLDTGDVSFNDIVAGTWKATTIGVGYGGTGTATAPTQGGIIYGASATAYGCTAAGTAGQIFISNGTSTPLWYGGLTVAGTQASDWVVTINGTSSSSSTSTGSLIVNGGVGIAGAVYTGSTLNTAESIYAGTTSDTVETGVYARSNSGTVEMYSIGNANSNGNRGLWFSERTIDGTTYDAITAVACDAYNNISLSGYLYSGKGVKNATGSPMFYFLRGNTSATENKLGAIFMNYGTTNSITRPDRMYFRQYTYNSSTGVITENWHQYRLPEVTADLTSKTTYEIITTKNLTDITSIGKLTSNVWVSKASGTCYCGDERTDTGLQVSVHINSDSTNHGLYSNGYYNGSVFTESGAWLIYRNNSGTVTVNGNCTGNAATATRINGNLAIATSNVDRNIWVSSGSSGDGVPNYITGFYMNPSTKILAVPNSTRITTSSQGALYLGNSGNQSWVYVQDMASQASGTPWKLTQAGALTCITVTTTRADHSADIGLIVQSTDTTNPLKLGYIIGTSGNGGIYDYTHSDWKVKIAPDGTTTFSGNAATATSAAAVSWQSTADCSTSNNGGTNIDRVPLWSGEKNGNGIMRIRTYIYGTGNNAGDVLGQFVVRNYNSSSSAWGSWGGISIYAKKDGTFTYGVSSASNFRTAIGAGTSSLDIGTTSTTAMAGNTTVNQVSQGATTTGSWRKIVLSGGDAYAAFDTTVRATANAVVYVAKDVSVQPSTGSIKATKVYNAVWNDYAECRVVETEEPGYCVTETTSGQMIKTTKRLQAGCKITSDTYGTCMGETTEAKTPIAVAGRVLAYPYRSRDEYPLGAAVCSAPGGTIDIMTRDEIMLYPERIVGTVSEIPKYETWSGGDQDGMNDVKVNGRIWIYVR